MAHDNENLIDVAEKIRDADGNPTRLDRRLFMQLLCFGSCADVAILTEALEHASLDAVLYLDMNDPEGIGLLTWSEDPLFFVSRLRLFVNQLPFKSLRFKPEYTMMGRTYALGNEPNGEDWLLHKPARTVRRQEWRWAIWYPLRRKGSFAALDRNTQRDILMEHGRIGHAFGKADLAHDVRLACHGLDRNDNDFVIGLVGKDLHPLSATVQIMRDTRQTSEYLAALGPFFIGRAIWQG